MSTIPLAAARANFSQLVEEASATHERVEITKNGLRAAVLLGADDYDSLIETIEVLADRALMERHIRGVAEIAHGETVGMDEIAALMASLNAPHDEQ
jgi:antitoxin YefM